MLSQFKLGENIVDKSTKLSNILQMILYSFVAQLSKFAFRVAGWVLSNQFQAFQGFP